MLAVEELGFNVRCTKPIVLKNGLTVPCSKCIDCRVGRTSEWTTRILHELHGKDGLFVTLTYNEESLPVGGTLVKEHLQKFMKRLRKHLGETKIKYFACGEYGESTQRPHYHIIIIGWKPDFKECYKASTKYWASREIERIWNFGNNTVGYPDKQAIDYVVGYIRKKIYGKKGKNEYAPREAPFQLQSQGIGFEYAKISKDQIFYRGIIRDGKNVGIPRYYKKKLVDKDSKLDLLLRERAKNARKAEMRPYYGDDEEIRVSRLFGHSIAQINYLAAKISDEERRDLQSKAREGLFKKGIF